MKTNYASPLLRFLAFFIDASIVQLPTVLIFAQFGSNDNISLAMNSSIYLLMALMSTWIVWGFYESLMHTYLGGTIGKLVVGIRVVDSSNNRLSLKRNFFRTFIGGMLSSSILYLGYIWIIIDKKTRRGWHDLVSDSYVVSVKNNLIIGVIASIVLALVVFYLVVQGVSGFITHKTMYADLSSDIAAEFKKLEPSPTPLPTPVSDNRISLKNAKVSFVLPADWTSQEIPANSTKSLMQPITKITHSEKVIGSDTEQTYTLNVYQLSGVKPFTQTDLNLLESQISKTVTVTGTNTLESNSGLRSRQFPFGPGYYLDLHGKYKDGYKFTASYVFFPQANNLYLLEVFFPFDDYVKYELDSKGIDRKDQIKKIIDSFEFGIE